MDNKLPGVVDWIKESLRVYFTKASLIYLTKFALLQLLVTGVTYTFLIPVWLGGFNPETLNLNMSTETLTLAILGTVFVIIVNMWISIATILGVSQVVDGGKRNVRATFGVAARRILPYLGTMILMGLVVVIGLVLLIVPGLVFLVWFYFASYITIVSRVGPVNALKKSRALVKGRFWKVAGRISLMFLYFWAMGLVLSILLLPLVQMVVTTLIAPYYVVVPYLLFRDLKTKAVQKSTE